MKLNEQKIHSRDIQLSLHSTDHHKNLQVLCVHGFLDHGRSFVGLAEQLQGQAQFHLLDRRGYGNSSKIAQGRYEFFMNMVDLANVLDTLETDKRPTVLLGHSIGGLIALLYAGAFPDQFKGLILLDCFGIKDQRAESPDRLREFVESQQRTPKPGRHFPSLEAAFEKLASRHPQIPEARLKQWGRDGLQETEQGWQFKADRRHKGKEPMLFREDIVRIHAARIQCPSLALRGADSSIKTYPDWLNALPNCQRGVIENAGHMLHLEQEQACAEHLQAFLAGL